MKPLLKITVITFVLGAVPSLAGAQDEARVEIALQLIDATGTRTAVEQQTAAVLEAQLEPMMRETPAGVFPTTCSKRWRHFGVRC